jgi:N,N'-diacetyllegionaminate synthase
MFEKFNPFIIAEAGINHNGKVKEALKLVDAAKKSNVSAIKFQTYITEKRTKKDSSIFDILKKCELKYSDFKIIKDYCDEKKIIFFSTPFDIEAIDFLETLKVKLYKISSFDVQNFELIQRILKTKKPCIFSTGMTNLNSITNTYKLFKKKNIETGILHCISSYPNTEENSFLSNIKILKQNFKTTIGLSDHTTGIKTSLYSYILGARIIEKHFKISPSHKCVDSSVSIVPAQMIELINQIDNFNKINGRPKFGMRPNEEIAKAFKRKKIL